MISGEHVPKLDENGQKPRPTGLTPLHTMPRLRSRGDVMYSSVSEPRIGCRFDRMDRKACTRIKGPTIQRKDPSKSGIHLPGRSQASTRNVDATEVREEPEGGRPARTCLLSGNASYTDSRRQSGTSTQRRWPDGQNPRPAGLGEAGRPHSVATQALASREG